MRDLLPPLVLAIGLMVAAEARAEGVNLDDIPCDAGPLERALCDAHHATEEVSIQLEKANETIVVLEKENAARREREAVLEKRNEDQAAQLAKSEKRVPRQRLAGVIVGAVAGASVAYGSVWLAGRL